MTKPVIRWAGSKRKLLPKLAQLSPKNYNRYIEPFCGSACLFLELEPAKAILSDSNSALINSYQKLKSDPSKVLSFVLRWPRTKDFYYTLRATIPSESKDDVFGAARFLYLNRLCFNGVYRENKSGYFNVPYAESRSGQFPTEKEFLEFSKELQKAEIVCSDFGESLDQIGRASCRERV